MFAVLFLSCEILLKWFGYKSRTFPFSTLERITIKQTGYHFCLLHMHAHMYKIHVSICHASDTGQNYLNKKCFLQSWNWLLLLWHFPLLSDIFKRGFHATESIVYKGRKMTLWIFFLASSEKKINFFLSGFYTFKKKLTPVTHQLFAGRTYCDVLMQHSSIMYKFWSSVSVTMPWISFHVLW